LALAVLAVVVFGAYMAATRMFQTLLDAFFGVPSFTTHLVTFKIT